MNEKDFTPRKEKQTEVLLLGEPDHRHAWRATWNRPLKVDERDEHPFTIARMTDHNVRGRD